MKIVPFDFSVDSSIPRGKYRHGESVHNSVQSVCYDGESYIVGFAQPLNLSTLVRVSDLSFTEKAIEDVAVDLPLGHCNDMAVDKVTGKIYVAGGGQWIGVVDPKTLKVEGKIQIGVYAWAVSQFSNGDWFVFDGDTAWRFRHDFTFAGEISLYNLAKIVDELNIPYDEKKGKYPGCWQGSAILDDEPFMIYNEYGIESDKPESFVLMSCGKGSDRVIYRAETSCEVESQTIVNGKMMLVYGKTYQYGGASWEMSEITTKTVSMTVEGVDIPASKDTQIELAKFIPSGYQLVNVAVNLIKQDGTIRTLPIVDNGGLCQLRVLKVVKNRVYLKSIGRTFNGCSLQIIGFCQKK